MLYCNFLHFDIFWMSYGTCGNKKSKLLIMKSYKVMESKRPWKRLEVWFWILSQNALTLTSYLIILSWHNYVIKGVTTDSWGWETDNGWGMIFLRYGLAILTNILTNMQFLWLILLCNSTNKDMDQHLWVSQIQNISLLSPAHLVMSCQTKNAWRQSLGHVNNIPTMQCFSGISRNTQNLICYHW